MEYNTTPLTNVEFLSKICFSEPIKEDFSANIQFISEQTGIVNSALLSSKILINKDGSISLGSTFSLNPLIAIPLPERQVNVGDKIAIFVEYKFGGGFPNFNISYAS